MLNEASLKLDECLDPPLETGNAIAVPSKYSPCSTRFQCLSIDTIRHKMKDVNALPMLQTVMSNAVSLTCSKNKMFTQIKHAFHTHTQKV